MACELAEFPTELSSPLLSFVVVTGLDITHNAVHRAIWDLLINNRQADRVPVRFSLFQGDHEYPRCKQKRSTYEFYVPKGILNVNWMSKHLYKVPALVVVFYDLDWDEMAWSEKLMELRSKLQIVRASVERRNTKVAVVLIQRSVPMPPGEDMIATERATALCNTCDLSGKLLYVFPHTDHMYGYVLRLENAFYELAQNYYLLQAKQVKSHREHLNKITHQLLFVRYQFKMGFYNELKCDAATALRNYKQAYANLLEIRTTDTNIAEVKMVSGFINYKICKLCFYMNTPLDSISQFRKHIDIFKLRVGSEDLAFEHCAWMSKQFSSFGDLFEEAIKLGLSAIQTQHPGFYYQQAAIHAVARKKKCQELCHDKTNFNSNILNNMVNVEYYGQRPWRPGLQTIEPPDSQMEMDGINALKNKEIIEVNHTMLIIPLLSNAIVQFKKYRCPRMKRYLVVQMGEEYFDAKDYSKALALLSHVIWDYKNERWWSLLTHVLLIAIKCAYLVASVQDYVTICIEMLGPYVELDQNWKETVQNNLITVLSGGVPKPEPDLNDALVEVAEETWNRDLVKISTPSVYNIEMNHSASFIECRAMFNAKTVYVDQLVSVSVYLRVSCNEPIRFSKLSVLMSNQNYNDQCTLTDSKTSQCQNGQNGYVDDLLLEPGKDKVISFSFSPLPTDSDQQLQISSVYLQLGDDTTRCAILHWKNIQEFKSQFTFNKSADVWDRELNYQIQILPRESNLKLMLEHEPPALINEFYPIKIYLINCEKEIIENVTLSVINADSLNAILCTDLSELENMTANCQVLLGKMVPESEIIKLIYVKCKEEDSCSLTIKVEYKLKLEANGRLIEYSCLACEELTIPVLQPFTISVRTLSPKMEPLDVVWCEEPFIDLIEIKSSSPWPLLLKSSSLKLDNSKMDQVSTHMQDVELNSGDSACECHFLTFPSIDEGTFSTGTYLLKWKRKSAGDTIPTVESINVLPAVTVLRIPISINLKLPTHGWVRTPLTIAYKIHNKSTQIQEYDFCMDSSDSFMFAGHKQAHYKILPGGKLTLAYNLYPLASGFVDLPKLKLLTHDSHYDAQLDGIVQKSLPEQIFIMPQSKRCQPVNLNSR